MFDLDIVLNNKINTIENSIDKTIIDLRELTELFEKKTKEEETRKKLFEAMQNLSNVIKEYDEITH